MHKETNNMGNLIPTCLILCAGKATRLQGAMKQLLPVPGPRRECFLTRIIRQTRQRGGLPQIVTNRGILHRLAHSADVSVINPGETDYTCETLSLTVHQWKERTIILLGDTIYSASVMDSIFTIDDPCSVWGNEWEIYAISFKKTVWLDVLSAIDTVLANAALPLGDPGAGKLRRFYQAYCGIPFGSSLEKEPRSVLQYVHPGLDYTRDVDTPEDWISFNMEIQGGIDDI
jgi:hypothetical protein